MGKPRDTFQVGDLWVHKVTPQKHTFGKTSSFLCGFKNLFQRFQRV